jgi:hypothetical protein
LGGGDGEPAGGGGAFRIADQQSVAGGPIGGNDDVRLVDADEAWGVGEERNIEASAGGARGGEKEAAEGRERRSGGILGAGRFG